MMTVIDHSPKRSAPANVIEATRAAYHNLRKSERKVADILLADPRRLLPSTLAQTAELADVGQPTVIRFCAAIGCSGFQEFKLRLAHSVALGTPATHSVLSEEDDLGAFVQKIFDYTITSLDWARNHLDLGALEQAIKLLRQAHAIEFFGFGASGIVACDAQQKFPLFGVPCGAQLDSHQQIMAASMMGQGDVAVVISNTGRTRSIVEIARTARGRRKGDRINGIGFTSGERVRRQAHGRNAGQYQYLHADDFPDRRARRRRHPVDRSCFQARPRSPGARPPDETTSQRIEVRRRAVIGGEMRQAID